MERICWNPEKELVPEEKMKEIQLEKIKKMIKYVYKKSPFYRKKYNEMGLKPEDIKTIDDFYNKVPFTTKEDLREMQKANPPLGDNLCVTYEEIKWIIASTGTTGKPTYTGATKEDWKMWMESCKRMFWLAGCRPGDVYFHGFALGPWISGITFTNAARELGMTVVPAGVPTPAPRMLTLLQDTNANVMFCTPSYAEHLAMRARELGYEPRQLGMEKLGCGGEPGAGIPSVKKRIEELWDADCRDIMGTPEQIPGNWAECEMKNGMHFPAREFCYNEIVDPETNEHIEPDEGVTGTLVYTALEKECHPLIRFNVNDMIEIRTIDCECGYPGFTMTVIGRIDDMLKVKGVKTWPSAIKDILASMVPRITGEFKILLEEEPIVFAIRGPLRLRVEYGEKVGKDELPELRKEIMERVRNSLYFTPDDVELVPPGSIPPPEFKTTYVEII